MSDLTDAMAIAALTAALESKAKSGKPMINDKNRVKLAKLRDLINAVLSL